MVNAHQFSILIIITSFILSCNNRGHIESGQGIFSLHVSSDTTGSVLDTGTHQISESGEYELIAGQPSVGYAFSYWKVVSGEENITILNRDSVKAKVTNVIGDASIKAIFKTEMLALNIVTLPAFTTDSITVSPQPDGNGKYAYGTNVTIRIFPKASWEITGWKGSSVVASDSLNILIKNSINDTILLTPILIPANIICVKFDALQNGGGIVGSSWVDAYTDLNAALAVSEGKTVWVAKGTYKTTDINTPFTLHANSSVIGGFDGTETVATTRDSIHNATILSGQVSSTENARAILNVPLGADNVYVSTLTIKGSVGNTTAPYGGVYALNSKKLTLQRCILSNNSPCAIEAGNKSKILQCVLTGNSGANGSAVSIKDDSVFIFNSVISGNTAEASGAITVYSSMHAILVNNTIVNNTANSAAGIYCASSGRTFISNCIFWGNKVSTGTGTQINLTDTVYYTNIQDSANSNGIGYKRSGWSLTGNLDTDPLFVSIDNLGGADGFMFTIDDGLTLRPQSPCTNAGGDVINHNEWKPAVDIRGKSRLNNRIDMGAYEQ